MDEKKGAGAWAARMVAWLLSMLVFLAVGGFIAAAFLAIQGLGFLFKFDARYSTIVGAGCIAAILGHGGYVVRAESNAARMLHGISMLTWLLLAVFFSATYAAMSLVGITAETAASAMPGMLGNAFLPLEVIDTGRTLYSMVFAIGLITTMVSLIAANVMGNPLADVAHGSIGTALAHGGETVIVGLFVATSALHMLNYGLEFARVGLFAALMAMVLAELTFVVSEKRVIAEITKRGANQGYDAFDLWAWGILAAFSLVYMVLVNYLYGRLAVNGGEADGWIFQFAKDFYGVSGPVFGGLLALLSVVTAAVNVNRGGVVTVSRPAQAQIGGGSPAALRMAKDEPAAALEEGAVAVSLAPKVTRRKQPTPGPSQREGE